MEVKKTLEQLRITIDAECERIFNEILKKVETVGELSNYNSVTAIRLLIPKDFYIRSDDFNVDSDLLLITERLLISNTQIKIENFISDIDLKNTL